MSHIYEPGTDLKSKIGRRLTAFQSQRRVNLPRGKAVISFTFDDCPLSGITNGVSALEKEGWQSTVYVACGLFEVENHHGKMMGASDAQALHKNGHEIGGHTYSHVDGGGHTLKELEADIERNQAELVKLGIPKSQTFAYPFGEATPKLKSAMEKRFIGARGIHKKLHRKSVDLNQIGSFPLFSDTIQDAIAAVNSIANTGGWLTFFTHDVRDNPSSWGCTPDAMQQIIQAVKNTDADVQTIQGAITAFGDVA